FSVAVMQEFSSVVEDLERTSDIRRIIFASGKPSIFIAGADVTEFSKVTSAEEVRRYVTFGQTVFGRIERLPQVTVAAINGACMGGGCELALSCDYRVMADSPKASIGLPEVKLGIIPAWGGTTKLPRLIGIPAALDIILNGKSLDAKRARRIGVVDEVAPAPLLLDVARSYSGKSKRRSAGTKFFVEGNPLARRVIFSKARKAVLQQTRGKYPAPLRAIEVMERGFSDGVEAGLVAEADAAADLVLADVAQNLVRLFFLMENSKKDRFSASPREVRQVGVLGAGVMGGGIAQLVVDKSDATARMRDVNWQALAGGLRAAGAVWKKKVDRKRMNRGEMQRKLARISTTTDWSGFSRADLVVEAVVENLAVKRQVLSEFESIAKPGAIFATNTSTIPITQIAEHAAHPENVVGMHFFNPVDRMPLVEVIRGKKTSEEALVTVATYARQLGKTVVHCNDGPGFVVNRILAPYMNEAGFLLEEGYSIESIDAAIVDFGMPMGPMALLDEVGIDVAAKVASILSEAFAGRVTKSSVVEKLVADDRKGKKNGRGLYVYEKGKRQGPDRAVYPLLGIRAPKPVDAAYAVDRMVLPMINEAATILSEKIVATPGELDLAMIMGTGFPPFRGGLLRYADALGAREVVARLEKFAAAIGPRYAPMPALLSHAERDAKFYDLMLISASAERRTAAD
ncbi:MAG TPA: 3-hydroxyacyl-CoA dehydrogenase NAD-binding domain-containing protein, partial [Thermoanaerobaculia bacterium]|nr:3-hydroxyacyl-CoA dehydrogenase NAD-binding domain-containing protein [Thermoanaerobaculia bacterium]